MNYIQPIFDIFVGISIGVIGKWYYDNFINKRYNTLDEVEDRLNMLKYKCLSIIISHKKL